MRKGGRRAGGIVVCKISNILIVIVNKEMFAQTLAIKINILKLVVKHHKEASCYWLGQDLLLLLPLAHH